MKINDRVKQEKDSYTKTLEQITNIKMVNEMVNKMKINDRVKQEKDSYTKEELKFIEDLSYELSYDDVFYTQENYKSQFFDLDMDEFEDMKDLFDELKLIEKEIERLKFAKKTKITEIKGIFITY